MPGISAVSPPTRAQPARRQPSAMPAMTRAAWATSSLAGGEVVEKEQRLGALHDEVVHAHGDEVDADGVVAAGVDGQPQFGADAVGGGDQHGVAESGRFRVEQGAEAADAAEQAGPGGGPGQRLDALDQGVAGVDVHAGRAIGHACHAGPRYDGAMTGLTMAGQGRVPIAAGAHNQRDEWHSDEGGATRRPPGADDA